jgi:hypothetical protein
MRWLERMGSHSQGWHNLLFRNLVLKLVQMDELYTRVRATPSATWAYAQTEPHLPLHCEWFRLYYHLVRAHQSLSLEVPGLKRR